MCYVLRNKLRIKVAITKTQHSSIPFQKLIWHKYNLVAFLKKFCNNFFNKYFNNLIHFYDTYIYLYVNCHQYYCWLILYYYAASHCNSVYFYMLFLFFFQQNTSIWFIVNNLFTMMEMMVNRWIQSAQLLFRLCWTFK